MEVSFKLEANFGSVVGAYTSSIIWPVIGVNRENYWHFILWQYSGIEDKLGRSAKVVEEQIISF